MPDSPDQPPRRTMSDRLLWGLIAPLVGVTGALAIFALIYLGYDVVKGKISPCDAIFQQASVGLTAKIHLLKVEGEVQLGRDSVSELDERAQMTALDLKTCCTVLDAGRLDPEQFLQCKAKARTYDARIEDISALVHTAVHEQGLASAEVLQSNAPIQNAIETARSVSRYFNQQVVQVAKDQALQTLLSTPPNHVVIDAAEHEPNDDILNANVIELGKLVKASIGSPTDNDFYTFTTPKVYRDWIRIEVQNQSTTLDPNLELFDASKTSIGGTHNTTAGGDLAYEFVAPPDTKFTVRVSSYYARNTGVYLIRVAPEQTYDSFEPNDDILSAKRIKLGTANKANIMDKDDVDFYSVDAGAGVSQPLTIQIDNRSASLHPNVVLFDGSKTQIGDAHNSTAGGDLTYDVGAAKGPIYVRVSDYYVQSRGDYTLTIISH